MIRAIRRTWASEDVEGVKKYYIYGHREGIEFPEESELIESRERYWPNGGAGDGGAPLDVERKRKAFAIDDCIYSDTPEGRENLYYKTIDGFEWLLENEDFDYLIRPSAGSYIDLHLFKQYLDKIGVKDNFYAGSIGSYNNSHSKGQPPLIRFASGSGFIASRNLIEDLVARRNSLDPVRSPYASATITDDVTIAKHFAYTLGVDIVPFPKYQFTAVNQITNSVKDFMHCYFTHTINPDLMYAVHKAKGLSIK
tara:strand:- start:153 stop:911 length:759 start_codon:yes stop_codon:yes gene_type:complete